MLKISCHQQAREIEKLLPQDNYKIGIIVFNSGLILFFKENK